MRTILAAALAVLLASGCSQTPRDLLTGGKWTCTTKDDDDSQMTLTFEKDGKLAGTMASKESAPGQSGMISLKMEMTGSWSLAGKDDLTFGFDHAKVTEAKRDGQDLDPTERAFFEQMFSGGSQIPMKISSISGAKVVISPDDKDDPLTCTR